MENYYKEIKRELINNEVNRKIKDYSINRNDLNTRYNVGKMLSEAGKHYGDNIIGEYAKKLTIEVSKEYNKRTLFRMKQFYLMFQNEKVSPVVTQLNWSHFIVLLPLKDINEVNYYIEQVTTRNLSKRQLQDIIKNKEYERLDEETKKKLINKEKLEVKDLVKNPIIIKNNSNKIISEKILQKLILEDISSCLKELGNGFTFIDHEYKIKIGDRYNYIDLLLFNYIYNCFVVIELKVTELKKEHIGQIETYMNYIDKNLKRINQGKTIGIIIIKKDNKFIMEYCSDNRIISREYELL